MRTHDNMRFDFSLVTTYLPILFLCFRAGVLVIVLYTLLYTFALPVTAVLMIAACIVATDAFHNRLNVYDTTCGHLCLCALAVLTQQHKAIHCYEGAQIAIWIVDFAWCLYASFEVSAVVLDLRIRSSLLLRVFIVQAFAITHVVLSCQHHGHVSILEMLMRVVLFYVLQAVIMLSAPFVPNMERSQDRTQYQMSIPVICMQILFAHLYPVAGNVVLFVILHTRLLYSALRDTNEVSNEIEFERQREQVRCSVKQGQEGRDEAQADLMALLLAAKAANNSKNMKDSMSNGRNIKDSV